MLSVLNKVEQRRLDLVESVFDFKKFHDLENVIIIGAQHILPSTLTMLESFFDRGLSPEKVFLIGKCYSTDFYTYEKLQELGIYVCPSSLEFNKKESFDSIYYNNIMKFAKKVIGKIRSIDKSVIVVLDDGGDLIFFLNDYIKHMDTPVACVEQTTSGYQKIKNLNLNMSVVNVARSHAKLNLESKIVVKTAIEVIERKLFSGVIQASNILIFGNGAMGSALASALRDKFNVSLTDIDPKKSNDSHEKYLQNLSEFDLIIGCVGKTVLSYDQIKKIKSNATLISLSSSDREFEISEFRGASNEIYSCHSDFECCNGIKVLNCGFPINFSEDASQVDIEEFELTRALLTLGVLQAIELKSERGLFPLDRNGQMRLTSDFLEKYQQ